jgi:putative transposase
MSRNVTFTPGEYYHIYNRGTEKRTIFKIATDFKRFLTLLYAANGEKPVHLQLQGRTLKEIVALDRGETLIDICAYCLMPNHFHLLVRERVPGGISKFMQKLTTGYTMYFNKRHDRTGSLFQGKFKATHVSEDTYLKYLMAYIHLNPVKLLEPEWKEIGIKDLKKAQKFLNQYDNSSFLDYANGERPESIIIKREALPEYFLTSNDFIAELSEWLNFKVEP